MVSVTHRVGLADFQLPTYIVGNKERLIKLEEKPILTDSTLKGQPCEHKCADSEWLMQSVAER